MPEDMQTHSQLYGVEIDSLSGRIAQALYPDADIAIQGFEQNRFQNGGFDVAVGNVPFGELGFRDTVHDTTNCTISSLRKPRQAEKRWYHGIRDLGRHT